MHVGTFLAKTSTGSQAVTGVGFQPAALIFFWNALTAAGTQTGQRTRLGFATPTQQASCAVLKSSTNAGRLHDSTACVLSTTITGSISARATLSSMDSDGFTISWSDVSGIAEEVNYIAFTSGEVPNASIVQFQCPAGTGSQSYTGAGFKPDAMFTMSIASTTAPSPAGGGTYAFIQLGMVTASSQVALGAQHNNSSSFAQTAIATDKAIYMPQNTSGNLNMSASLTSFDSDGFTLNWLTVASANEYVWALCLKGGQYAAGSDTQKTSTGTKATTGVGFAPTGVILLASNRTAAGVSTTPGSDFSMGAASSTSARAAMWAGSPNGSSNDNSAYKSDKIMTIYSAGTPTLNAEADLSSLDADGFTPNWTTADATARLFLYFAVAAKIPTISSSTPSSFHDADTGVVIVGTGFQAAQGTGVVKLSPTDDVNDAGAVEQTVTSWADTSIEFTVDATGLSVGGLYLFVKNDAGYSNASGFVVTLESATPPIPDIPPAPNFSTRGRLEDIYAAVNGHTAPPTEGARSEYWLLQQIGLVRGINLISGLRSREDNYIRLYENLTGNTYNGPRSVEMILRRIEADV